MIIKGKSSSNKELIHERLYLIKECIMEVLKLLLDSMKRYVTKNNNRKIYFF